MLDCFSCTKLSKNNLDPRVATGQKISRKFLKISLNVTEMFQKFYKGS